MFLRWLSAGLGFISKAPMPRSPQQTVLAVLALVETDPVRTSEVWAEYAQKWPKQEFFRLLILHCGDGSGGEHAY